MHNQRLQLARVERDSCRLIGAKRLDCLREPRPEFRERRRRRPFDDSGLTFRQTHSMCRLDLSRRILVGGMGAFLNALTLESEFAPIHPTAFVDGHDSALKPIGGSVLVSQMV